MEYYMTVRLVNIILQCKQVKKLICAAYSVSALQPTASYYVSQESDRGYVWRLFSTGMEI